MTPAEIEVKIACARREMEYWQGILKDKSCHGCANFQQGGCVKAGGITPPLDVQKVGCPEWVWDCVPF